MKIDVFTADFAQTDDRGKLNAIGLGWSTVQSPLPPHSVAVIFELDWHETNEVKTFAFELVDQDGRLLVTDPYGQVSVTDEDDPGELAPLVRLEGKFEVGRPPGLAKGTALTQALAVTLPGGMPLPLGRYTYRVRAEGVSGEQTFTVTEHP